jgi:ABC-type arginine transport system permease subunit
LRSIRDCIRLQPHEGHCQGKLPKVFRGALASIHKGQIEAARALALPRRILASFIGIFVIPPLYVQFQLVGSQT